MPEKEIYLDNNATTRPLAPVREIVCRAMGSEFGNPSSAHGTGERARGFLREARKNLAGLIGCSPSKITFTSSGTEANNMAFYSCTRDRSDNTRIIITTVEHSSIQKMCNFLTLNDVKVVKVPVDSGGTVDMEELEREIRAGASLVSVQWVNNETGVIQPLTDIGNMCAENGVPLHTDAAQAAGKMIMDVSGMPIDFLSLTGHKFHAPQGVGALYSRERFRLAPLMFGGFQEDGFRPGTENVPGIAGIGKAAQIRAESLDECLSHMKKLRDRFEEEVLGQIPGTSVNGNTRYRVCNTTNIKFGGIDGRRLVRELDSAGVRCSQSSACTNYEVAPSYVLRAMGLSEEEAYSSIRFSFSVNNSIDEIEEAARIMKAISDRIRN